MNEAELKAIEERASKATDNGWDEIWKAIPGTNGTYEVSNLGSVRSHLKKGNHRNKLGLPRNLKVRCSEAGYPYVSLPVGTGGKYSNKSVHRLVAEAFLGPCPKGKEVAHLNGDPSDARLVNLEYLTHAENESHKKLHGTATIGEKNGQSKLVGWQVAEIKYLATKGLPQINIARLFELSPQTISEIVLGDRWSHVNPKEDVPALVAEVRRLRKVNEKLSAQWNEVNRLIDETYELLDDTVYADHPTVDEIRDYLALNGGDFE